VQLREPLADRVGVSGDLRSFEPSRSAMLTATITPLIGCRGRFSRNIEMNASQDFLSALASESWVV